MLPPTFLDGERTLLSVWGAHGCAQERKTDHSLARSCTGWRLPTSLERELTYTRHRAAIFRALGDRLPRLGDRLFVVSDVADGPEPQQRPGQSRPIDLSQDRFPTTEPNSVIRHERHVECGG